MKPVGVNPFIKSYIYNTYCIPKLTYGMGIFKLSPTQIKEINTKQNNIIRFMLGIPMKCHISNVLKVLGILNIEYLLYTQICILVKLLHRHVHTKSILLSCFSPNPLDLDLFQSITEITNKFNINKEYIIFYPDKTRQMILDHYFYYNVDSNVMEVMTQLFQDYTFSNKKKILDLIKLQF